MTTTTWITRRDAAKTLKVSVRTIDRMIRAGQLRSHAVQGANRILLDRAEVAALVTRRESTNP